MVAYYVQILKEHISKEVFISFSVSSTGMIMNLYQPIEIEIWQSLDNNNWLKHEDYGHKKSSFVLFKWYPIFHG